MRHICFTDPHVTEKSIAELEVVFMEILRYSKEAAVLVCVGDFYDRKNPNATEIEFGTKWIIKFTKAFKHFYMVTGNHPDIDGKISSVSYMEHLGVTVVPDIVLDGTYYGHFMVKESLGGYNETLSCDDLKQDLSILGHQHTFQEMVSVVHPGSVRYVDFGEVSDKSKFILLVDDCTYLPIRLTKCRPMFEVTSVSKLPTIPKEAMVRVVIKSFKQFLEETDELKKWEDKFFEFKLKLDFENLTIANQSTVIGNSNKEIVSKWLNDINNLEVKDELLIELTAAGLC